MQTKTTMHLTTSASDYLIPTPSVCPLTIGKDFEIDTIGLEYHWEGLGDKCGEFCSADGFESEFLCVADALYNLCVLALNFDHEDAVAVVDEQALPTWLLIEDYA